MGAPRPCLGRLCWLEHSSQGGLGVSAIFTLFLVPILLSLLMDIGYHTHKDDLVKDSLVDPREVSASGVPAE